MNRRNLVKAAIGGAVLVTAPTVTVAAQERKDGVKAIAYRTWRSDEGENMNFWLASSVMLFRTNEHAKDMMEEALSDPQHWIEHESQYELQRIALPSEIETFGDDSMSFFVHADRDGQDGFFSIVRVQNVLYQFIACSDMEGMTNGAKPIIRSVMERAKPKVIMNPREMLALLPSEKEAATMNLTSLTNESYTSYE